MLQQKKRSLRGGTEASFPLKSNGIGLGTLPADAHNPSRVMFPVAL